MIEKRDRSETAQKAQYRADHNVRQVVNPQVYTRRRNHHRDDKHSEHYVPAAPQQRDRHNAERSRCVTRRERVVLRTVYQLFLIGEMITRAFAFDKPFYHKLADKLSKSEGKDDVYACLSRRGVNEKRQTNRKPDYSQITRRGSGDHYSVFNRGAESDDVVNDLIIELLNPMKHNNTSSDT